MDRNCLHSFACPVPYLFFFFFFQAEDGIRDADVTGVQTCALPIWISLEVGGMVAPARILACSTVTRLRSRVCSSACRVIPAASAASSTPMPSISTMRSARVDADACRVGESRLRSLHSALQCSSVHFIRLCLP